MRYPEFDSFDDLLYNTYKAIKENGKLVDGKRGKIKELHNYAVTLKNCRSRTSRSLDRRLVRSKFAEFLWYLGASDDKEMIAEYINAYTKEESKNEKILGAYGSKIFGCKDIKLSQFERVIEQIRTRQDTKQAYIAISESFDYRVRTQKYSSPPCTVGLHFIVRDKRLNLTVYMRSNDAYLGLPHDLFCFTMLQEIVANRTGIDVGSYSHVCTSMHIYDYNLERVTNYLNEGIFEPIEMPILASSDSNVLKFVVSAFFDDDLNLDVSELDDYWSDFYLFSRKFKNMPSEQWISLFRTKELKEVAQNSITD